MENISLITNASIYTNVFEKLEDPQTQNHLKNDTEVIKIFSSLESLSVTTVILLMGVFGMFANGVTIYVIMTSSTLRSVFDYFILSLASSDLISAIISPLTAYYRTIGFDYWNISTFLCKVFWSADMGTSVLTSIHITVYSMMRFIALKWPVKFTYFTRKHVKIVILVLWSISILCGSLPFAIWMSPIRINKTFLSFALKIPSCGAERKWIYQYRQYSIYGFSVFFFIPFILILLFSCGIAVTIIFRQVRRMKVFTHWNGNLDLNQESATKSKPMVIFSKKEKQGLIQLLLIVSSFLIGYFPTCAYQIYGIRAFQNTLAAYKSEWWFGVASTISLRFSECLNPIFYNIASSKFRAETLKVLKKFPFFRQ